MIARHKVVIVPLDTRDLPRRPGDEAERTRSDDIAILGIPIGCGVDVELSEATDAAHGDTVQRGRVDNTAEVRVDTRRDGNAVNLPLAGPFPEVGGQDRGLEGCSVEFRVGPLLLEAEGELSRAGGPAQPHIDRNYVQVEKAGGRVVRPSVARKVLQETISTGANALEVVARQDVQHPDRRAVVEPEARDVVEGRPKVRTALLLGEDANLEAIEAPVAVDVGPDHHIGETFQGLWMFDDGTFEDGTQDNVRPNVSCEVVVPNRIARLHLVLNGHVQNERLLCLGHLRPGDERAEGSQHGQDENSS